MLCYFGRANLSINYAERVSLSVAASESDFCVACVPNLYYVGNDTIDNKMFHIMVMDQLGPSLEDLFQSCKRNFDLKTVLQIAIQMVSSFSDRRF